MTEHRMNVRRRVNRYDLRTHLSQSLSLIAFRTKGSEDARAASVLKELVYTQVRGDDVKPLGVSRILLLVPTGTK